ncbi:hypothetical protein DEJ50_31585 [Streptomyces venezuelae]|uniref:Uncharacterized protein n=1 Tax=Streptomyces venezuelae TaxID=54571 RepID=A0A5P2DFE8_STRVZ|nr:hypothetical protein [Streptomyces venezuelae]QES51719.1 hypothetical protein DEJ50_31585 [Streptomyces venezuelae]
MKDPFACEEQALLAPSAPADRAAARRTVAARAVDRAELLLLIDMLGLHPEHDRPDEPGR